MHLSITFQSLFIVLPRGKEKRWTISKLNLLNVASQFTIIMKPMPSVPQKKEKI